MLAFSSAAWGAGSRSRHSKHHLALLRAAPAARDAREFRDAGLAAAAKQAAERVKNVVAGGAPRGGWQIREAAATDMLRQCPGRILVHSQTFRVLLLSRTSEHPNDGANAYPFHVDGDSDMAAGL